MFGNYDEHTWLNIYKHLLELDTDSNFEIGIYDNSFCSLEIINIQLMLRFLTKLRPDKHLHFANKPCCNYTKFKKETIIRENYNSDLAPHLGETVLLHE